MQTKMHPSKNLRPKGRFLGNWPILILMLGFLSFGIRLHSQGTTKYVDGAHLKLETPKGFPKKDKKTGQARYNAPVGCVIVDYKVIKMIEIGSADYTFDLVASNSKFITSQQLSAAFDQAQSLAVQLNIQGEDLANLEGELNDKYMDFESLQTAIEASHQTLAVTGSLHGAGAFKGRTELNVYGRIELLCIEDYLLSPEALKTHLEDYVKEFAESRGVSTVPPVEPSVESPDSSEFFTNARIIFVIVIGFVIVLVFILRRI